jgi:hypothetical protein
MSILKEDDLDFAKLHIEKYYDSDFFPKPIDFGALWASWDEVKKELLSKNVNKLTISTPRILAAPKPSGTFRVVHQLDPMDCLVYTALVSSICDKVEAARPPSAARIACSYRIEKKDGSFFASGTGYPEFTERTEELAQQFAWVLSLDISDFYNQIYLHRIQNAVEFVDGQSKVIADDIEYFLTALNSKVSQGIPVGPAASIVLAEAILLDVDNFITSNGVKHTRYVDDFRIFGSSREQLEWLLRNLTIYLYENHRLSIATEKTRIHVSAEYVSEELHNSDAEEREDILDDLDIFGPYLQDVEEADEDGAETASVGGEQDSMIDAVLSAAKTLEGSRTLDLGVARATIRTARRLSIKELVDYILKNFCFYAPVASDVFIYLDAISDAEFVKGIIGKVEAALKLNCTEHDFLRYWFTWYLSRHLKKFNSQLLRVFVYESPWLELVAIAAVEDNNLPWIRGYKNKISDHTPRERRALIYAGRILPADEREAWLKNVINNSVSKFDIWMAKWVLTL